MNGSTSHLNRIKCGQIFILSNNKFTLVCKFCQEDCYVLGLEGFVAHVTDHFPEWPTSVKIEDSINDCASESGDDKAVVQDDMQQNLSDVHANHNRTLHSPMSIKIEDSISINDEYDSTELRDDIQGVLPVLENNTDSQSLSSENHPVDEGSIICQQSNESTSERDMLSCSKVNESAISQSSFTRLRTKGARKETAIDLYEKMQLKAIEAKLMSRSRPNLSSEMPHSSSDTPKISKSGFECSFCRKIFTHKRNLKAHENIHTGKRPHKCQICLKTFIHASHLKSHVQLVHTKDRRHICLVCDKSFGTKQKLDIHTRENHLRKNDPRRYFPCNLCDHKFDTQSKLYYHKIQKHQQNLATFTCDICQRVFNHRRYIVRHMLIHGPKNHKCQHCNKTFTRAYSKCRHERKCVLK